MQWFTSDPHFGHRRLLEELEPKRKQRFISVAQMDQTIINNINAVVLPNDTLYMLGDWCVGSHRDGVDKVTASRRYREWINCNKVIALRGNHDPRCNPAWDSMFVSVHDLLELKLRGQEIVLCHYAMRIWNGSHKGWWHLYGHSHGNLPDDPHALSMDVGVDACDYRPLSFDQIREHMGRKVWKPVDHHVAAL